MNPTVGYSVWYPGGWRTREAADGSVRITRYGDTIAIVARDRPSAPTPAGYEQQLEALLAQHNTKLLSTIDQPARRFPVGKDSITRAVIEQERPAGAGNAPEDTLVTYRYLFWKDGKLVEISMSSVKGVDNGPAWDLIARSFRWQ